jgi:hypothetical protein
MYTVAPELKFSIETIHKEKGAVFQGGGICSQLIKEAIYSM